MKSALCVVIAGMSVWAAAGGMAQPAAPAQTTLTASSVGDFQVREVNVVEIDISHIKLGVDLSLVAARTAILENLRLCSLHLNGMPVYALPLNQELVLNKGVTTALPPIYVTILFRDVHSTDPLRRMVENQSVRLDGEMVADVRLNMVEKLALHTQHPSVALTLNQDVPVDLGGKALERNIELNILGIIDAGLKAKSMADKYIQSMEPRWIQDLQGSSQANLYVVESSYTLTQGDASYPVTSKQLGFRISPSQVVTTAEAETPWKYDAEFLDAVQSGAAKLVKNSLEMQLQPIVQGDPLRLSTKDFTVEMRGTAGDDSVIAVSGKHSKMKVLRRASPGTLAVLTLHAPPASQALAAAPAAVATQDSWEHVAVFRLRTDAVTKQLSVDVLIMGARHDGQGIRLSEPVDAAVFGSPIVTPDGVIGLVQDEKTGAFLPTDLQATAPVPTPVPAPAPIPAPAPNPAPAHSI